MEYPPQPPQVHYHYQVPPPPQRNIWRWVVLGIVSGVLLCLCSTLVVSCMNAQRQQQLYASSVPSFNDLYNRDSTATAEARKSLFVDDGAPSNPWNYNYEPEPSHYVYNDPPTFCRYFKCATPFGSASDGYVVECNDGLYTHDGGKNTACTGHGGVKHALYWH